MRRAHRALAPFSLLAFGAFSLVGCTSDDSKAPASDASMDAVMADGTLESSADARSEADSPATMDARGDADAGVAADAAADAGESGGPTPSFLVHFDVSKSQLPEGLWQLGDGGPPIVGFAQLAMLATVPADGGAQTFGSIGDAGASNSFTLGVTTDTSGNVYVGVGVGTVADAGNVPAPGVYKFSPDGGVGTLFSSAPGMNFANGLDFVGANLFVADSDGFIYRIDPSGVASVWSSDPLLAPNVAACDGGPPLPIGANGIVHDIANFYVTNTNHGRVVKIPIAADGGPGAATTIVDSCAFAGADGLVLDTRDNTLLVAINTQNMIVRVALDGGTNVVASGSPLDFPASLIIDSTGTARRLLFTNGAIFSGAAGQPGLLALPIP